MTLKVLVIAVHPDDETLGCGGTLLRHRNEGDSIYWCIVTEPSKEAGCSAEHIRARNIEIERVAQMYEFSSVTRLGVSAGRVGEKPLISLVAAFSDVLSSIQPDILYLPFLYDVHSDHRYCFNAVISASKSFRQPSVQKILMMETQSETEFAVGVAGQAFVPNHFVDITKYLQQKLSIAKIYSTEFSQHPFPRSQQNIESLAVIRGATSGCFHAEAFQLIKEIRR